MRRITRFRGVLSPIRSLCSYNPAAPLNYCNRAAHTHIYAETNLLVCLYRNFGIFKHPGSEQPVPGLPTIGGTTGGNGALQAKADSGQQRPVSSRGRAPSATEAKYEGDCIEKLHAVGLLDVYWHGKCEPEKVTTGSYQVKGQGGMFALVSFGCGVVFKSEAEANVM